MAAITLTAYFLVSEWRARRKIPELEKDIQELQHFDYGPRRFSYKELQLATKKFSDDEIIGKGGCGTVYKGSISRRWGKAECKGKAEALVAVKRICKTSSQAAKAFVAEIKVICRLTHKNVVPLLGWCYHRGEMLLVYEYMPNGNLQELLFCKNNADVASGDHEGGTLFPWEMRMNVLRDVAAALVFMHEDCEQRVVHRDVKSSNILLDQEFTARLGDFGLARLYDRGQDHHSTDVAGTIGYLAPESIVTGNATSKTDVYSFGALALEVATGRKPSDWRIPGERGLVQWVWRLHSEGRIMDAVDINLGKNYNTEEMRRVLKTGLFCCLPDRDARPTMREVEAALQGESPVLSAELPPFPVFDVNMLKVLDRCSTRSMDTDNYTDFTSSTDTVPQFNSESSFLTHDSASATPDQPEKGFTDNLDLAEMRRRSWS